MRTDTVEDADLGGEKSYGIADGKTMKATQLRFHSLQVGEGDNAVIGRNIIGAMSGTPKAPLLLGQTFLRQFTSTSIDHSTSELVIDVTPNPNPPKQAALAPVAPAAAAPAPDTPYQPPPSTPQPAYRPPPACGAQNVFGVLTNIAMKNYIQIYDATAVELTATMNMRWCRAMTYSSAGKRWVNYTVTWTNPVTNQFWVQVTGYSGPLW
jgi:hypothetical protein